MASNELEVSVVMPCLNEKDTVGSCVKKSIDALAKNGINGEVVISDNGSTDNSVEIAKAAGARVVHQKLKGYGNAYMKGISEARGKFIVMADSDDTYPFDRINDFVKELRNGKEYVMGSRLRGKILPGAMPPLHQYIGNPGLTAVLNLLFNSGFSDTHCGLRAFTKDAFVRMKLKTPGMEFASEMVIRASQLKLRSAEIPIDYYPRPNQKEAKLNTFRDGWRHLRFMVLLFLEGDKKNLERRSK